MNRSGGMLLPRQGRPLPSFFSLQLLLHRPLLPIKQQTRISLARPLVRPLVRNVSSLPSSQPYTLAAVRRPGTYTCLSRSSFSRTRPSLANPYHHLPRATTAGPVRSFHHGTDAFARHFRDSKLLKWTLIGLNVGVFLAWNTPSCRTFLERHFALSDRNVLDGRWWTAFGCNFLHPHLMHLAANMVALHACLTLLARIGLNVFRHQIPLIVGGGLAASAASIWYNRRTGSVDRPSAGASGYVCGMISTLALMRPHTSVYAFYVVRLPMWALATSLAAFDFIMLDENSIINHQGHLGGSAFGALFWAAVLRRRFGGAL